jgi:hypothetical protein
MQNLKLDITIDAFLKQHYNISDTRTFFLNQFKYYSTQNRLEFDDTFVLK